MRQGSRHYAAAARLICRFCCPRNLMPPVAQRCQTAVPQRYAGQVQGFGYLVIQPIARSQIRSRLHRLQDDIRVQDDHSNLIGSAGALSRIWSNTSKSSLVKPSRPLNSAKVSPMRIRCSGFYRTFQNLADFRLCATAVIRRPNAQSPVHFIRYISYCQNSHSQTLAGAFIDCNIVPVQSFPKFNAVDCQRVDGDVGCARSYQLTRSLNSTGAAAFRFMELIRKLASGVCVPGTTEVGHVQIHKASALWICKETNGRPLKQRPPVAPRQRMTELT